MPVKISFECSRPLTEAELLVVRQAFSDIADKFGEDCVKTNEDGTLNFDDVPEYFYVVPLQEEI